MDASQSLRHILQDLRDFAAAKPTSAFARDKIELLDQFHNTIETLERDLLLSRTTMSGSDPVAQLAAQLQALTQRLNSVEAENAQMKAQLSASPGQNPTAAGASSHNPRIHNPIKLDLPRFNGEGALAARDFYRCAAMLPSLVENAPDSYLLDIVASRLSNHAAYWIDQWRRDFPTASFQEVMDGFKAQFVDSRETQTVARAQLYKAEQHTTVDALYQYIAQRLVILKDRPLDIDVVTLFIQALKDEKVKVQVFSKGPKTLNEAYKAAHEAMSLFRSVPNHNRGPPGGDNRPRPPHLQQQGPSLPPSNPRPTHNPRAYALQPGPPPAVPEVRLQSLDSATRQMCIEQNLCFRCRQPGHGYRDCPKAALDFRRRGVQRRR
jgi:uncharacterized coiled-coil protein SlyX